MINSKRLLILLMMFVVMCIPFSVVNASSSSITIDKTGSSELYKSCSYGAVKKEAGVSSKFGGYVYELIPNSGYTLKSVELDKKDLLKENDGSFAYNASGYNNPICIVPTDKSHKLKVSFAKQYKVTTTLGNGGSFGMVQTDENGSVVDYVAKGNDYKVYFMADEGYKVSKVTYKGEKAKIDGQGANMYVLVKDVEKDTVVNVTFEKINNAKTYKITAKAGSNGKISPVGNVLDKNKKVAVTEGESMTFNIVPNAGYTLKSVKIDKNEETDPTLLALYLEDGLVVKNVLKDVSIKVEFAKKCTIKISAGEGGGIAHGWEPEKEVTLVVPKGANYIPSAVCEKGYSLKRIIVDGKEKSTKDFEKIFKKVEKDHTVRFEFEKINSGSTTTYTVNVTADSNGKVTPSGTTKVLEGGSAKYSIAPNDGYEIEGVTKTNNSGMATLSLSGNILEVKNVKADITVKVTFKKKSAALKQPTNTQSVTQDVVSELVEDPAELADAIIIGDQNSQNSIDYSKKYTLTVKIPTNSIRISPKGQVPIYKGETKVFTVTPKAGYAIKSATTTKKDAAKVDFEGNKVIVSNVTKSTALSIKLKKVANSSLVNVNSNDEVINDTENNLTETNNNSNNIDLFIEKAKDCAKYFYDNYNYDDEGVPGVKGNLDCVSFVEYVLRDYFKAKDGEKSTYALSKFSSSNIKTWLSEAKKLKETGKAVSWMSDNFTVVAINTEGIYAECDNNLKKVKELLQPGDILVFYDKIDSKDDTKHIEILGSIGDINTKKNELTYGSYTVGNKNANYKTLYKLGNREPWSYERGIGRFEFMKAVLRLK